MKYLILALFLIASQASASEALDDYYAEYSNYEKEVVTIYVGDKIIEKPITLDEYFEGYVD